MAVAILLLAVAALLAPASAQAINGTLCNQLAQTLVWCVKASQTQAVQNGPNAASFCCVQETALLNSCGGLDNAYNNAFWLTDIGDQQTLAVQELGACPIASSAANCTAAITSVISTGISSGYSKVSAAFDVDNSINTFTFTFALPTGVSVSVVIQKTAIVSSLAVQTALNASSPWLPLFVTNIGTTFQTNYTTITVQLYANTSKAIPPVTLTINASMPAIAPRITVLVPATPLSAITPSSPQCGPAVNMQTACSGYQLQSASMPNYAPFPFDVSTATDLSTYVSTFVAQICPGNPQTYCTAGITNTRNCLKSKGYLDTVPYQSSSCCQWASFTNYACQGYNITQLTASLGLAATEVPTVNKQLSDCAINNNNGGNGNNNQCSAVLPNLFAWTVNNTVVPITSYCNPSDPNDANAKMGCSPVTVVNGKTYFLFKPLQGSFGQWYYSTGCIGM